MGFKEREGRERLCLVDENKGPDSPLCCTSFLLVKRHVSSYMVINGKTSTDLAQAPKNQAHGN